MIRLRAVRERPRLSPWLLAVSALAALVFTITVLVPKLASSQLSRRDRSLGSGNRAQS